MITERDLQEAIAACHGVQNPSASTCAKLASYYTILDHVQQTEKPDVNMYSLSSTPDTIQYSGQSDFSKLIHGQPMERVWSVIDEAMTVIQATHPRLYNGIINKLKQ